VSLLFAEQLQAPTFASSQRKSFLFIPVIISDLLFFLDIMFRLQSITTSWHMASASYQVYDSIISQFQAQVSEFAEELLVAKCYYEDNPNFWIGSGLIEDANSQQAVFNTCHHATSNFKGVSSSDAAKQLFEAHMDILQGLGSFLGSTGYDGNFFEAHGWHHLHALSEAVSQL